MSRSSGYPASAGGRQQWRVTSSDNGQYVQPQPSVARTSSYGVPPETPRNFNPDTPASSFSYPYDPAASPNYRSAGWGQQGENMTSQPDNSTNDAQNDIANSTEIDDETDIPDYDQESPQERDRDRDRAFVASNGNFERLDPRYILRNDDRRDFFCLGRVLMIIFSDAMGYNVSANARPSKGTEVSDSSVVKLGQEFHFSERRMVIVNPGGGQGQAYSICVPVSTYRGQGALKHGIRKQNHAMLYKQFCFEAPKDEERMTKTPIEMIPTDPGEKWHPASRIDFGRLHTVQYNIPIRDVGMVHPDQIYLIGKYYRDTHFPRKRNSWRPPLPRSDLSNAGQPSLATLSSSGAYSGGRASAPSEAYSNQPTYSGTSFRGQPQEGMVEWNDPNRNTVPNPSGYQRRPGSYATR